MCAFSKLHKWIDCLLLCLLALQNRLFFITVSSQEYCVEAVNIQYKIQLKNSSQIDQTQIKGSPLGTLDGYFSSLGLILLI